MGAAMTLHTSMRENSSAWIVMARQENKRKLALAYREQLLPEIFYSLAYVARDILNVLSNKHKRENAKRTSTLLRSSCVRFFTVT